MIKLLKRFFSINNDTIFALSSGLPPSGVSIIRLSGSNSLNILKSLTNLKEIKPKYAYYTSIKYNQKLIDNGLCLYFNKPFSYTGEDIVEFQIHGSPSIINNLLSKLSNFECRPAYKGEFTKRAFLNNKLDLTQVEGLYDLINSYTELQGENSQNQYNGYLSKLYYKWKNELLNILTITEGCIDFGEEEDIEGMNIYKQLIPKINNLINDIKNTLNDSNIGNIIKSGLDMILVGPPNVGKSSFYNLFLQYNYSIVSSVKGTTRDILKTTIDYDGIPLNLYDTAGIHDINKINDDIEKEGINRAINTLKNDNDIPILLIDCNNFNINDYNMFKNIQQRPWWMLINKIDLVNNQNNIQSIINKFNDWNIYKFFQISCKNNNGIKEFKQNLSDYIKNNLNKSNNLIYNDINKHDTNVYITHERHKYHLNLCIKCLEQSIININNIELCSEDLREAVNCIGRIIGTIDTEQILDNIFSKFCIGK